MIWLLVALLALGVLAFLAQPLFRTRKDEAPVDETDYLAAQLADVARDRAAGVLSDEEADIADLEARRRLLADARKDAPKRGGASPGMRQAAVLLVGAAPAAAIALYLAIGNPGLGSTELAVRVASQTPPAEQGAPSLEESIRSLEARLEAAPDDADGWTMLAESYANLDRFAEAAAAFDRAAALAPERAYLHAARGEALTMANNGVVSVEATAALEKALEIDPAEPRARFYIAIGQYQDGDKREALGALVALANDAPDGAGWLAIVNQEMAGIAAEIGLQVDAIGLSPRALARLSGPAAARAAPGDVASLEAQIAAGDAPYTAWIALAEAYAAEGNAAKVAEVLASAEERWAAAPFVMQEIAQAKARLAGGSAPRRGPTTEQVAAAEALSVEDRQAMIAGMVEGLAARLEAAPDDLEGWLMLGRSYGVLGDWRKSVDAYAKAVALAPSDLNVRVAHAQSLIARQENLEEPFDAETMAALNDILKQESAQPFALFFLGVAAQQANDPAIARAHWEKLLAQLPPDSADAARVKEMIGAL